ncbi:MAG TPA: GMC family oxidoreductase [Geminicoccus sp.]|jgi:choline dehydrogenase|uniref:GMC family oxidoreductase n=1 Tax=Geminicoccus sp. TaxID=2024832 RepID=UPI002E2FBF9A|nr:GMC family oxidoreductase [Geminicoccus sp.]HEX2529550.1 GMC family oxidoreductase [Geminicoccus sp.]
MRVIVVGAGTGGATFAGRLAKEGQHEVVLVEAGPDFGPFDGHGWPFEMLDSRRIPTTYDWGLENQDPGSDRSYKLERAKIMGGCSAHNGCAAVRGIRSDFEKWSKAGGADFWNPDEFLEDFAAVDEALNVRTLPFEEFSPYQQDFYHAAIAAGLPHSNNINDIDEGIGVSICPMNKKGGIRWNAAFGFVDPVRGQDNFSIEANFEVTELLMDGRRVTGVRGFKMGEAHKLSGDMVVLASGAYGSPMLMLRSGIGDPATLKEAGIELRHDLPGVGRNLQDHPAVVLNYQAKGQLIGRTQAHEKLRLNYDEGTIVKVRSPFARDLFDMHIFSVGGRTPDLANWYWQVYVALLTPLSRGQVRPVRKDGSLHFAIEHSHVTDLERMDVQALTWGVEEARRITSFAPFATELEERTPGIGTKGQAIQDWIQIEHQHYYHPASTCSIGRDPSAGAVVDVYGRVHGLEGLMVADASIMPYVTIANTNIPTAALAHRLARNFDAILGMNRA